LAAIGFQGHLNRQVTKDGIDRWFSLRSDQEMKIEVGAQVKVCCRMFQLAFGTFVDRARKATSLHLSQELSSYNKPTVGNQLLPVLREESFSLLESQQDTRGNRCAQLQLELVIDHAEAAAPFCGKRFEFLKSEAKG